MQNLVAHQGFRRPNERIFPCKKTLVKPNCISMQFSSITIGLYMLVQFSIDSEAALRFHFRSRHPMGGKSTPAAEAELNRLLHPPKVLDASPSAVH